MTREEAVNVLNVHLNHWKRLLREKIVKAKEGEETIEAFEMAIEALKERPHGEWFGTVCTNCGESTSFYYDCNYCPQCGADMGIKGGEAK